MNLSNNDLLLLQRNPLFKGLNQNDITKALYCLRAHPLRLPSGSFYFEEGEKAKAMGFLLEGQIDLLRYDIDGNTFILESFLPGESFGEVYALEEEGVYGVNAYAKKDCRLLSFEIAPLYDDLACPFGKILFKNLVKDLAEKDRLLKEKVSILSQKGLERKVLMLLSSYSPKEGVSFVLPFSREEMANYLACERSALSRLLSTMAKRGLLSYEGNRFTLYKSL